MFNNDNPESNSYERRAHTQSAYGGYCQMVRAKGREPMPYHEFSNYVYKGMRVKEIVKMEENK